MSGTSAIGAFDLLSIEAAFLTGGVLDNIIDASGFDGAATLDGAAGTNTLKGGSAGNAYVVNAGNNTLFAGIGQNVIVPSGDVNFTLDDLSLSRSNVVIATFAPLSIQKARLTGGPGLNVFTLTGWSGLGWLDGGDDSDSAFLRGTGGQPVSTIYIEQVTIGP